MHFYASLLIALAALVLLALGSLHLLYTYHGRRFHPRDEALEARMKQVSPRITRETTMWRAGIGFHASHSLGAMLYGMIYLYLAVEPDGLLFRSPFLMWLGLSFLSAWLLLARVYWFKVPLIGLLLATALHAAGLILAWS